MKGRVTSVKNKQTATVLVTASKTHPLYKKSYTFSKKYLVHDELGVSMGDLVEIIQTRPISKMKRWKIEKVVGRSIKEMVAEELKEKAEEAIDEVIPEAKEELDKQLASEPEPQEQKVAKKVKKVKGVV
jgi:small subunit ribosomal protein S17